MILNFNRLFNFNLLLNFVIVISFFERTIYDKLTFYMNKQTHAINQLTHACFSFVMLVANLPCIIWLQLPAKALATFYQSYLTRCRQTKFLTFFELVQSPVLLIIFPLFCVGQIKQMTLVFFPCSLHTLLISCCPSTVE